MFTDFTPITEGCILGIEVMLKRLNDVCLRFIVVRDIHSILNKVAVLDIVNTIENNRDK